MKTPLAALALIASALLPAAAPAHAADDVVALTGATVHVGDGRTLENATVVIEDGTIVAVGANVSVPGGATVIDLDGAHVTPGLVDANARLEPRDLVTTEPSKRAGAPLAALFHDHEHGSAACTCSGLVVCSLEAAHEELEGDALCPICGFPGPPGFQEFISGVAGGPGSSPTEASSEVVCHTWVADGLNLRSPDLDRLARGGVTTVYASPDNAAVIGPRGAIVRTAGPVSQRLVREAADVHAVVSPDTFRVGGGNASPFRNRVSNRTRRPSSRMGVAWVFRKAFHDARNQALGHPIGGADTPPADAIPVLQSVLDGEQPLRIASRTQRDIETAFRLADELGLSFTLLEATEAHAVLPMLSSTATPVVFGPIDMNRTGRGSEPQTRLTTIRDLLASGVPVALSAMDRRDDDGLARQAMMARKAGCDLQAVLTAVTLTPARLLGLDDEIGSVAVGKRADLVVWGGGEPFGALSRPLIVMSGGATVVDARPQS